ncbi:hypothetical protein GN956_G21040 [Arapaima gigas]
MATCPQGSLPGVCRMRGGTGKLSIHSSSFSPRTNRDFVRRFGNLQTRGELLNICDKEVPWVDGEYLLPMEEEANQQPSPTSLQTLPKTSRCRRGQDTSGQDVSDAY